jgi:hypothetical protein
MRRAVSVGLLFVVWLIAFVPTANATTAVQYVSVDGNDSNNGLSWTTPLATVAQAISNLPPEGGVVWVASPGSAGMSLGKIDPVSKSLDLILGCSNNYTADQIVLRNNFHLRGCGSNSANPGTVILATGNQTDLFMLGGSSAISGVWLQGFRIDAENSNTNLNGIHIAAQANGGGLWYSTFEDIYIGCAATSCTGFGGVGLDFDGSAGGNPKGLNQFISVRNVTVVRSSSTAYACQWLGANGQFVIDNLECDGPSGSSTGTNVNIASTSAALWPYSLSFNELTTENANLAVNISGAVTITFHQAHLETDNEGFLLSGGTGGVNTYGITIEDSEFMSGFVNGGAGFLVKTTTGPTNSNLNFFHNRIGPTPANFFIGFTTNLFEVGTLLGGGTYRTSTIQGLTVDGNLVVTGTKSAGVKLPDGRSVALYAVESPENWFEDFGTAHMTNGVASVRLDQDFLAAVDTASGYHVFVVPNGPCGTLYVAKKGASAFEVREIGQHLCKAGFDYRVVAKRLGFEKLRMEPVQNSASSK